MTARKEQWPKVSIVVPCYNASATIAGCLLSLLAQEVKEPYEIIVVDSSTDNTPELVASGFPSVRLISVRQKLLPGAARNMGVKNARGDVVAFIDADCVADRCWLAQILEAYRSGECAAVAGSIANANPESLVGWGSYAIEFSRYHPRSPARELESAASCNLSVWRQVFESYGFFQEEMFGSEDIMYTLALTRRGLRLVFAPAARVFHVNNGGLRAFLKHQYVLGRCTGTARTIMRMPGAWALRSLLLLPAFVALRSARIGLQMARWEQLPPGRLAAVVSMAGLGLIAFSAGECVAALRPSPLKGYPTRQGRRRASW